MAALIDGNATSSSGRQLSFREAAHGGWAVGLVALVLLAAALRFTGLAWGLRHPVHSDERVYVDSVVAMVEAGDLDHRFYTYPGLFFYVLAPGIALLGPERWHGPDAYLVSRALVALIGVLNVPLVFFVGTRLVDRRTGMIAALLLAVSPLGVRTSHQVRPDVLLETFGMLALLVFRRLGSSLRGDALAGLTIGAATAIKFTGLLLVPFYLAARLLAPGRRVPGMVLAGAITITVTLAATPYAVIHAARYQGGPRAQLAMYYQGQGAETGRLADNLAFYGTQAGRALSPIGPWLVMIGALLALRRSWREWLPRMLHPLAVWLVMSTPLLVYPRLILPSMGLVTILAAMPLGSLARRWKWCGIVCAAAVALMPLRGSVRYVNLAARPSTTDKALDWLESHVPPGARLLETRPEGVIPGMVAGAMLGVDPVDYEIVPYTTEQDEWGLKLLAREVDVVITAGGGPGTWGRRLRTVYKGRHLKPPGRWRVIGEPLEGAAVLRFYVADTRPRYRAVDLSSAQLDASENRISLPHLIDHDAATTWSSETAMAGDEWIEIALAAPEFLGRVEVFLESATERHGPSMELLARENGGEFVRLAAVAARPAPRHQALARAAGSRRALSQLMVFEPRRVDVLRIRQRRQRREAWALTEIRLDAYDGDDGSHSR